MITGKPRNGDKSMIYTTEGKEIGPIEDIRAGRIKNLRKANLFRANLFRATVTDLHIQPW